MSGDESVGSPDQQSEQPEVLRLAIMDLHLLQGIDAGVGVAYKSVTYCTGVAAHSNTALSLSIDDKQLGHTALQNGACTRGWCGVFPAIQQHVCIRDGRVGAAQAPTCCVLIGTASTYLAPNTCCNMHADFVTCACIKSIEKLASLCLKLPAALLGCRPLLQLDVMAKLSNHNST